MVVDRRLAVFPEGRPMYPKDLGIFVELVKVEARLTDWHLHCNFSITVVNQLDPTRSISKASSHIFCQNQKDRGFDSFTNSKLEEVYNPTSGYLIAPKYKDLEILCEITPIERKENVYVGLENQGATCYLNSLLQSLFHIPKIRFEVYNIQTIEDDINKPTIPLALQALFYRLQYEDQAVSTKQLTKSFGWTTADSFKQHDVQELSRILIENLEKKLKGTPTEGLFEKLFKGEVYSYIKCVNVTCSTHKIEDFYDISLNVKGCNGLIDSFKKYCETEILDGDNKYNAGKYGLQCY